MEIFKIYRQTKNTVYEVSNLGKIKKNGIIIQPYNDKYCEYYKIAHFLVHRAVAELFIPNPENKPCVDHINTIKTDNRVENLRWVTYSENMMNIITRKHNSNAQTWQKGENNPMYGKYHTEETKRKMSVKKQCNNYRKGKKASDATKMKLSLSRAGKHLVLCEDGKKHFI